MRGVAAFYVVLQHYTTMIDPNMRVFRPGSHPAWLGEVFRFLHNGHFAVAAFIVLSGFCLNMSLYQRDEGQLKDPKSFLLRRCKRILPPYYACLAFSLVVCHFVTQWQSGPPWNQYLPVTAENLTAHLLMIHNFSKDWMYKINGVLWSISIEFQLYLVFPFLVLALHRFRSLATMIATAALTSGVLFVSPSSKKLYVWYFGLFVWGMVAARMAFHPRPEPLSKSKLQWAALLLLGLAFASTNFTKELAIRDTLMGAAVGVALCLGTLAHDHWMIRPFGFRPVVALGSFSYSLYLMHHPILQVIFVNRPEWAATPLRQFAFLLVVGTPIILMGSYLFYRVFERPFIPGSRQSASSTTTNATAEPLS